MKERQQNLVQVMNKLPMKALMHPNDPTPSANSYLAKSVDCPSAMAAGIKAGCTQNCTKLPTDKCGFVANTFFGYTAKSHKGTVEEMHAKIWASVISCVIGATRNPDSKNYKEFPAFAGLGNSKIALKDLPILDIIMNPGIALADMATDSWAFMEDSTKRTEHPTDFLYMDSGFQGGFGTGDPNYEPMEWAIDEPDQWRPADTTANASFPNSVDLQQSEACSCEGATPVYRTLHTLWGEVKRPDYVHLLHDPVWVALVGGPRGEPQWVSPVGSPSGDTQWVAPVGSPIGSSTGTP
jgi:hypothetical protein